MYYFVQFFNHLYRFWIINAPIFTTGAWNSYHSHFLKKIWLKTAILLHIGYHCKKHCQNSKLTYIIKNVLQETITQLFQRLNKYHAKNIKKNIFNRPTIQSFMQGKIMHLRLDDMGNHICEKFLHKLDRNMKKLLYKYS